MEKLLCPSMMCANFGNLQQEIEELEAAGADIFHVDIMDGSFVPNFGMGLQDTEYIYKNAKIPGDAHLMIQNPGNYVKKFAEMGAKIIYIHPEADKFEVMLDGACSPERVETLSKLGVKGFILGTSALFGKGKSYKELLDGLRAL